MQPSKELERALEVNHTFNRAVQMSALSGLLMAFCAFVFYIVLFYTIPLTAGWIAPVVEDVVVSEVHSSSPNKTALLVVATKVRECRIIDVVGLTSLGSDLSVKSTITFPKNGTGQNRPLGRQSFGVWEFEPTGDHIVVTTIHDCGFPWNTYTRLFEWRKRIGIVH